MDPLSVQLVGIVGALVTGGLAIAAQRAVTSVAGYTVIRHSKAFSVGDRIKMGGVQGDVIALGLLQTNILEMGQPHEVNEQEQPGMWVRARQYSGRIVTVTNDKVFDEAVYNFTRDFPFIWEEVALPVPFHADYGRVERILLDAAREATGDLSLRVASTLEAFSRKYHVKLDHAEPRVYWRLTDNWMELTVRFLAPEHGIRSLKDRMTRRIVGDLASAGIEIASSTFAITDLPPLRLQAEREPELQTRQARRS